MTLSVVIVLIVLAAVVFTASGIWWLPDQASNWAKLDGMILATTIITGIAFIVVNLMIAYAVYRFRHRAGHRAAFFDDNPRLEKSLIGVTALGIAILLIPGLFAYAEVAGQPPSEDALVVEVLAEQWRWSFRLPGEDGVFGRTDLALVDRENVFGLDLSDPQAADDVIIVGAPLHLPVDRPVLFRFRAKDVLHNFWVPEFRVKVDAVPGMVTEKWVIPTKTGTFQAACAELCGVGHYVMVADVVVTEQAEFDQWLREQPAAAEALAGVTEGGSR